MNLAKLTEAVMALEAPGSEEKMSREDILDYAKFIVTGEREDMYGSPEDSFYLISRLWSDYLETVVLPEDVATMMILLKIARSKKGFSIDNYVDIAGYAACGGEIASEREDSEKNDG